jgi:hypothetical protein
MHCTLVLRRLFDASDRGVRRISVVDRREGEGGWGKSDSDRLRKQPTAQALEPVTGCSHRPDPPPPPPQPAAPVRNMRPTLPSRSFLSSLFPGARTGTAISRTETGGLVQWQPRIQAGPDDYPPPNTQVRRPLPVHGPLERASSVLLSGSPTASAGARQGSHMRLPSSSSRRLTSQPLATAWPSEIRLRGPSVSLASPPRPLSRPVLAVVAVASRAPEA